MDLAVGIINPLNAMGHSIVHWYLRSDVAILKIRLHRPIDLAVHPRKLPEQLEGYKVVVWESGEFRARDEGA